MNIEEQIRELERAILMARSWDEQDIECVDRGIFGISRFYGDLDYGVCVGLRDAIVEVKATNWSFNLNLDSRRITTYVDVFTIPYPASREEILRAVEAICVHRDVRRVMES